MDSIIGAIIVFIVFYFIYKIIALSVRKNERMALIARFGMQSDTANQIKLSEQLLDRQRNTSPWHTLRIGLLLTGISLGLVGGIVLTPCIQSCVSYIYQTEWRISQAVTLSWIAMAALGGGIGLVTAVFIETCKRKKTAAEQSPEQEK